MVKKEWMVYGPSEHCGYNSHRVDEPMTDLCHWYRQHLMGDKLQEEFQRRGLTPNERGLVPCTYTNCPQNTNKEFAYSPTKKICKPYGDPDKRKSASGVPIKDADAKDEKEGS